jgi:hypothetical protein
MTPLIRFESVLPVLGCLFLALSASTAVPPIIFREPLPLLGSDVINSTSLDNFPTYIGSSPNATLPNLPGGKLSRRATKDEYLRILPLGASITQGVDSSTGNGYRKPLRDKLRSEGWLVNMVGTKQDGNMVDNVKSMLHKIDHLLSCVRRIMKDIPVG